MTLGAMTWTCLLLSAAAAQPDVQPMNQRAFQIPIRFDPQKKSEIRYLQLWVSHDNGQTWNEAVTAKPDQDHFDYAVSEDGPYWFTMVIIDQKGHQDPPNLYTAQVGQRLLVDTTPPDVKLTVGRQGDLVTVSWDLVEANPKTDTLKLEYAESMEGPWTPVPIKGGWHGHAEFQDPSAVVVRMQMRDIADNLGKDVKQAPAANGGPTLTAAAPPPFEGAVTPPLPGPVGPPPPVGPPLPSKGSDHSTEISHFPPPPPPSILPPPDLAPPPLPTPTTSGPAPLAIASKSTGNQVVAYSPASSNAPALPPPPVVPPAAQDAPPPARPETPSLMIVNKRQIKLEFDVGKFGPSGLGGVDVYVTTDDGATWQKTPVDAGGAFSPPSDPHSSAMRGAVTVSLQNEGVAYGYYLVVKSKAGLGKPAPHAGDPPQIRVELDATPPEAKLFRPQADPTRRDTLVLVWEATDKNLAANPVTLEWAAQPGPDAQWTPIGPGELPNTGRYAWQPTPDVPPNVYLRLTVRDTAGNRAVAQTNDPVLIDLSIPEVTNIGLGGTH